MAHLKESNEKTTAAIETKEGRFVVAAGGENSSGEVVNEKDSGISFVQIAEFALLIVGITLLLYFILRKK
ncbi:hypothetical protein ACIQZG_00065 [Lysinibacillus sp. NPDC096418]|uniref:hypothetical protein n=1 Tax=Lysinibacillus sp. NPDC096418 TaxID=3364138 RepID=UPI0037FDFFD7